MRKSTDKDNGILILDAETGKIVDVNPFLIDLLGHSKKELTKKSIWEIGAFQDVFENKEKFLELQQNEYVRYDDLPLVTKDGREIYVEFISNVHLVDNNKVIHCSIRDITARKETEAALEKTRNELAEIKKSADEFNKFTENIIDTVREPLLAIDQNLKVIKASRSFYKFFKVTAKETIGKLIYELGNHQWDIPKLKELLEKIIPEKNTFDNYEVEHNFSTIGKRVMHLNARQVKRAFGKEKVILLAIEDITERKGKEDDLKEKNRETSDFLESLLNYLHAPIIIWDTSMRIKRFSRKFELLSGYDSDEVIDKKIDFLFPKDKIAVTLELLKNHLDDEQEVVEIDILTKDNQIKTVLWNSSHILDEEGNNIVATISQDITSRRQSELALRKSESQLRTLVNTDPDLIWLKDTKGVYLLCNPMFERFFGARETDIIGKTDYDFFDRELADFFSENDRKAIEAGKPTSNEEWVTYAHDGHHAFLNTIKSPIYDSEGTLFGILSIGRDLTERKLAEQKVWASEKRFRAIFDQAPIAIAMFDFQGRSILSNVRLTETLGYTKDELSEMKFTEYTHPEDIDIVLNQFNDLIAGKISGYRMEKRHIHKNKNIIWSNLIVASLNDNNGVPQEIIGMIENITEQKQAEEALSKSEEMLRNSQSLAHIGAYSTDLNINEFGKSTWKGSPEFYKIFGIDETYPHTLEGWAGFIHPDYREELVAYHQYVVNEGIPFNKEYKINRINDGAERWVQSTGELEFDEMGTPVRMHGAIQDITERKRAEEKLRNLSEMQSIILRMASEYINMPQELVDKSINNSLKELGEFVQADRTYVFEYDWIKNVTNNIYEWCEEGVTPEIDNLQNLPNEVIDCFVEAHKDGKELSIEDVMQLPPDNGVRQLFEPQGIKSVLTLPMMKPDKCIGFVGFDSVRKIHKYSEKEKTLLKIFSEMLVNLGNRKELEKNLVQAKEKAEESDRLKSAFLANMSHEIRTPMNGILGFASLLKKPDLRSENQQKYIGIIEKSGKRMLNIINDIVDISKIEAGLMKLDVKETNINEQIEYVYTFLKPEAEAKKIKLSFKTPLPAKEAFIKTDSEKVYAILTNLLKNAIKYTKKGSIELGYHLKTDSEPGELEIYVKDTGIGVPKDRQEAIFERFIQADIADTSVFEGAGLGLAITKSHVEMLGGNIWVESQEGEGSTFYFTLPYNTETVIETINGQNTPSGENKTVRKLKILIAEDDEISEMLLDETVKMYGNQILKARTGAETVEVCRTNPDIDLILMDIQMPDMGGYEATHQIREFNKEVVIIAQTAYGLKGDREKSIESGCTDYIAKPINENELQAMIQKYFGK